MTDSLHMTFMENAMFLLDLASNSAGRSINDEAYLKSGPWAVEEFKWLKNFDASGQQQSDTDDAILLQHHDYSLGVRIR